LAAKLIIAHLHTACFHHIIFRRQGQIALAADVFAAQAEYLVINQIVLVGAKNLASRRGQIQCCLALLHAGQLRERQRVVFQSPIKRAGRNALRHQPSQHQAGWPEHKQWREHPIQNFAKQAALLTLENFHG
jgi:hypothetical protein